MHNFTIEASFGLGKDFGEWFIIFQPAKSFLEGALYMKEKRVVEMKGKERNGEAGRN